MEVIMEVLEKFQAFIWGPPTLLLLLGTGIYFTVTLKGIQLFRFPKALKAIFEKEEGAGDVSAFATLCTTLAADIGTGSIVGVATALSHVLDVGVGIFRNDNKICRVSARSKISDKR